MQIGIGISVPGGKATGAASIPEPPAAGMLLRVLKGAGITQAGGFVSSWADQSGNNNHLLQPIGANQPQVQGDGTVLHDGAAHFMKCATFPLVQPFTIYARLKQLAWASRDIWDGNAINSTLLAQYFAGVSPELAIFAASYMTPSSTALALNTYGSIAAVYNGATSVLQINATTTTGNPSTNAANGFTLGARADGGSPSNIQVAEIIVYNVAHAAGTRDPILASMAARHP